MLYIQIREILDYTRDVDNAISRIYDNFGKASGDNVSGQLADYLGRHYKRMSECISGMSDEESESLLSTHIPYGPQPADFKRLEKLHLEPDASVDELIDAAIEVDGKLVDLFKTALESPVGEKVREFFEHLVQYEDGDREKLRQIKAYY